MSKRLNKTQEYAILWMIDHNKTEAEIIKEIKISQEELTKFLEKHKKPTDENKIQTKKTNTSKAKDLMITKTSVKNNSGVSIMTKEASQVGDSFLQNMPQHNRLDSIIHKPNG